jgi:Trk K+ transport system NAD-binding subunit
MNIWLAISFVLAVVSVYLFVIEAFSVAFKLTGMATKKIRFQVASLFTSSGFTTSESELITNDDRRRRIATVCMYTGHIFSVLIMGLIINVLFAIGTINTSTTEFWYFIVFYVSLGLFLLVLFLKIPPINRRFQKLLETIAINSSKKSRHSNILTVIDLYGKHAIAEVILNQIPEFAREKSLFEMGLTKKYVINILSIRRGKRILDVTKDTMFVKGDILVIYGLTNDIKEAFINSVENKEKVIVVDRTNEVTLISNYGKNSLVEVYVDEVPKELDGVKIKDAGLNDKYSITVGVIKRKDEYLFVDKNTIIQQGDKVTFIGPYKNIKVLFSNDEKEKS